MSIDHSFMIFCSFALPIVALWGTHVCWLVVGFGVVRGAPSMSAALFWRSWIRSWQVCWFPSLPCASCLRWPCAKSPRFGSLGPTLASRRFKLHRFSGGVEATYSWGIPYLSNKFIHLDVFWVNCKVAGLHHFFSQYSRKVLPLGGWRFTHRLPWKPPIISGFIGWRFPMTSWIGMNNSFFFHYILFSIKGIQMPWMILIDFVHSMPGWLNITPMI